MMAGRIPAINIGDIGGKHSAAGAGAARPPQTLTISTFTSTSLSASDHGRRRYPAIPIGNMTSAKALRRSICNAIIASTKAESEIGSSSSRKPDIASRLDNIFADFAAGNSKYSKVVECCGGDKENDGNITPLMIACDQKCSDALKYLLNQLQVASTAKDKSTKNAAQLSTKQLIDAWGHPNDESSSGNRAAHHIMASGFSEGIDLHCRVDEFITVGPSGGRIGQCLSLLMPKNKNGDTPIMIACVFGHTSFIQSIVERTIHSALLDTHSAHLAIGKLPRDVEDGIVISWNMIRYLFDAKNKEGRTAFNLACGHGRVDIVKLLIEQVQLKLDFSNDSFQVSIVRAKDEGDATPSEVDGDASHLHLVKMRPLASLSHSDLDFCEKTVNKIVAGKESLRGTNRGELIEEFEFQYEHACECLSIVQCELERIAEEAANELCSDVTELGESKMNGEGRDKAKKKKKKKKKKCKTGNNQAQSLVDNFVCKSDDCELEATSSEDNIISPETLGILEDDTGIEPPKEAIASSPVSSLQDGIKSPTPHSSDFVLPSLPSAKCLRKRICHAISSQVYSDTSTGISSQLDEIFASFMEGRYESAECGDDGHHPTPLMIACDQKCSDALSYLINQIRPASSAVKKDIASMTKKQLIEAWGHPKDTTSCGSRASHDAMAAGFSKGMDILENIWGSFEDVVPSELLATNLKMNTPDMMAVARIHRYFDLFEPNKNGDTPIMMACVFGKCSTLQRIAERFIQLDLMIKPPSHKDVKERVMNTWSTTLKDIFGLKNRQGLSAFNEACGHGHVDIVKFLIEQVHVRVDSSNHSFQVRIVRSNEESNGLHDVNDDSSHIHMVKMSPMVQLSYSDLEYCQTTMDKIVDEVEVLKAIVKKKNRLAKEKEYKVQYQRTQECYCIVGNELTRIANEMAKELWSNESSSGQVKSNGKSKKQKKRQSKMLQNQTLPVSDTTESNANTAVGAVVAELETQHAAVDSSSSATSSEVSQKADDQSPALWDGTHVICNEPTNGTSKGNDASDKPTVIEPPRVAIDSSPVVPMHGRNISHTSQSSGFVVPAIVRRELKRYAADLIANYTAVGKAQTKTMHGRETSPMQSMGVAGELEGSAVDEADDEDEVKVVTPSSSVASLDGTNVPTFAQKVGSGSSTLQDETLLIHSKPIIITNAKPLHRVLQSTSLPSSRDDEDIASLMESLCLDPSMLLYSPHEMAIEMSPCQLEIIEGILQQQLSATKKAQQIHARLLNK